MGYSYKNDDVRTRLIDPKTTGAVFFFFHVVLSQNVPSLPEKVYDYWSPPSFLPIEYRPINVGF